MGGVGGLSSRSSRILETASSSSSLRIDWVGLAVMEGEGQHVPLFSGLGTPANREKTSLRSIW